MQKMIFFYTSIFSLLVLSINAQTNIKDSNFTTLKDSMVLSKVDTLTNIKIDTLKLLDELNIDKQRDISILKSTNTKEIFYGIASFYHNMFEGRLTSNGEIFNQKKLTCAHKTLPFNTFLRLTNLNNDSVVIVKVNDRLPPNSKRTVDLTYRAAKKLNFVKRGLTKVKIEVLTNKQFEYKVEKPKQLKSKNSLKKIK